MDYKKNAKYFMEKPSSRGVVRAVFWGILLCGAGAALKIYPRYDPGVNLGLNTPVLCIGLGIFFWGLAALIAWVKFGNLPTDADIEAVVEEEISAMKAAALKKLGLEEEEISMAEPIQLRGWTFSGERTARGISDTWLANARDVKGKDGVWRSPMLELHFFAFSENMVHYYYRYRSLVSATTKEGTDEFFYQDIVSAKSETEDVPYWDKKKNVQYRVKWEKFSLTTTGGTSISCSVRDSQSADASVKAMRSLLRQKKIQK